MKCQLCNTEIENYRKLSKHLRDKHKTITLKEYYDTHIKSTSEGTCFICGKETKYIGLGSGYVKTCSQSCACKLFRQNLKNDTEKFDAFRKKVKSNMISTWEERKSNNQFEEIMEKSKQSNIKTKSLMNEQERKEKFGWLNKLPQKEKEKKIKEIISPMVSFWQNASEEEIIEVINRRTQTTIDRYGKEYPEHLMTPNDEMIANMVEIFNLTDLE